MENNLNFYSRFHPNKCSYGMHLPNDWISSLPVEVVLIIVSLLPLNEMVRTSILSKRWLNLWVNTPVLDFGGYNDMNRNSFLKRINHVLQQHKGVYLKKFRIYFTGIRNGYQEGVDRWLEFALAKRVEILELDFSNAGYSLNQEYNYVFPDHWFIKRKDDGALRFDLKLLKSLSLKSVNVTGEAINFFLRSCPFLERLEVVGSCTLVNLVISDPSLVLKYLQIMFCLELEVMTISNFNLVSLDTSVGDLILENLPMLVELSIMRPMNTIRYILSQNATCLGQLKSLELHAGKLKGFTELTPQMTKLKRLVIGCLVEFDESLTMLLSVIKSCNHLEEFVLELRWYRLHRLSRTMQKVERLSFDSLKVFEFKGYYGRVSDVELMMHVAMNAPRLEKIIIDSFDMAKLNFHKNIKEQEREARRFALKHIEHLRESKHIRPHVDVYVRECT